MAERQRAKKESVDSLMRTHTLNNAQPHSKNSWWVYVCVGVFKCACSSHVSLCRLEHLVSQDFSPLQFLNKACSVKWRKNTRESIIQLSRFPLSLQTEKNSESDHCIGVGAGERDCFYQHKLCFNREYSAVNPLGWQSCSVAKV